MKYSTCRAGLPARLGGVRALTLAMLGLSIGTELLAQSAAMPTLSQDPAQIQKQREELERQRSQRPGIAPETAPKLSASPAPKVAGPKSSASFLLLKVEFGDSHLLSREELNAAAAPQLNRPTTFADVQALVQRINALYFERGHLTARALVPAQKIQDGLLKIQLVEATLARIDMPAQTRLSPDFVRSVIATAPGELINVPVIGERLERMHRSGETRLALSFSPAEDELAVGQSVINVQVSEPPRWTGRLSLSNEGNDGVGKNQVSFNGGINNLLGFADRLSLLAIHSKGSSSANLQFSTAAGGGGLRANAGLSLGQTKTLTGAANDLIVDGGSKGFNLGVSQPLALWQGLGGAWALEGAATWGETRSNTRIAGELFSDVDMNSLGAALTLSRQSAGSSVSATLTLSSVDTEAARLDPRNNKLAQLSFYAYQALDAHWSLQSHGQAQFTHEANLPSALQTQIGGAATVRGFAAPTASGDRGGSASLELHRQFDVALQDQASLDAFVFADAGQVRTVGLARVSLGSVGLGLNWRQQRWNVSASVAVPRKTATAPLAKTECYLRLSADL